MLYPHGSHLSSSICDLPIVSTDILDLSSSRKQLNTNIDKQSRSRSDSEHSTEPIIDSSTIVQSNITRKRNNLSESETPSESTTNNNNKSNLARTAILLAAKRAASSNNNINNYDGSTFTLMDNVEDEADSSAGLFKQRFDILDFIDEVDKIFFCMKQNF